MEGTNNQPKEKERACIEKIVSHNSHSIFVQLCFMVEISPEENNVSNEISG